MRPSKLSFLKPVSFDPAVAAIFTRRYATQVILPHLSELAPALMKANFTADHRFDLNAVVFRIDVDEFFAGPRRHEFNAPRPAVQALADRLWELGFVPKQAPKPEDKAQIAAREERVKRLESRVEELESSNQKLRDVIEVLMP